MEKFKALSANEATDITGGGYNSLKSIMNAINNGTYAGGSIIILPGGGGVGITTLDYVEGSPESIYVGGELVYSGNPRTRLPRIWNWLFR